MARRSLHSNILSCLLGLTAAGSPSFAGVDNASRYSAATTGVTRWMSNGHRGDIEFGVWSHEAVAESWAAAGRFIGSSTAGGGGDINTGGQSFGLYANPSGAPSPYAASTRKFAKPALTTGDVFSFKIAVNYRSPGSRGFDLRSAAGTSVFNFDARSGGYYVNNDGGSSLNSGYHANTVFTFTFTQRERRVDYTIQRTGGITASASGSFNAESGTIADVRFYISGAGTTDGAANNFYFNQFSLTTEARGDAPLTIGERRTPGMVPSYLMRFTDPNATAVTMRHGGDNFANSYSLTKGGDGVWSVDIRNVLTTPGGQPLQPGWHEFKFRLNSVFESGDNRWLYIDAQGRIAAPPAVYLTWQRDPTSTMTVSWYNHATTQNQLRCRLPGAASWSVITASTQAFPFTERHIHTAEITGLAAGTEYEFQVDGYGETFKFRTMPATLSRPVKFGVGGDVGTGAIADSMTAAISAKDPDFLVIGGDHSYDDALAENFWMWERYMESWFRHARAPGGRMIPLVVGIGNHEVRYGYGANHPDFDNSAAWRARYASYYYRTFAFPGSAQPYGVLDFGNYLSLIITDTEHSSPVISGADAQTQWLAGVLDARRAVPHLLPVHHVPAYTSYRSFNEAISQRLRQHWVPLYESRGVQLVFEHHDHTFKRTKPLLGGVEHANGIRYVGDGLWGIDSRPPDTSRPYLDVANEKHHVHLVTITASNRTVEAVDTNGAFFGGQIVQTIDGIPSAPITPMLTSLATNSASFAWTPVANATNYAILRNGTQIGTTTSMNFTDSGWAASSGASYQIVAMNRAGSFTNNSSAPGARQVWNVTNNLPWNSTGEGAATADPDADGIANLAEYFHGLNPRTADAATDAFVNTISSDSVGVRYRVNPGATGVQGRVERTADLLAAPWTTDGLSTNDLTGPWAGWRSVSLPIEGGASQGFLRLIISE
jgi:hypothetical protein